MYCYEDKRKLIVFYGIIKQDFDKIDQLWIRHLLYDGLWNDA